MTTQRKTSNRNRDWDREFRIVEAYAMGPTSERVSREAVSEDNRGFDESPVWPVTR